MDEAVIKRILPHSQEAEQAVIGAMLMNKDAITTASEIISGEDFTRTHTVFYLTRWWNCSRWDIRSI